MELLNALLIALVQGITEWLPISSSGHLVIIEKILNYQGGMLFDVALHFGTLMAVFVYFGADIVDITKEMLTGKWSTPNGRLGILILIATIPALIIGLLFKKIFEVAFSNLLIVGLGFGITGLFLFIGSLKISSSNKKLNSKKALLIGIAQSLALFPGISRSGMTISSGLLTGLDEKNAMKFSFLMAIPVIFGASILTIGNKNLPPNLIWATLLSFFVGLITIHILYKKILVSRKNLRWFAIYALLLGAGICIYSLISIL